ARRPPTPSTSRRGRPERAALSGPAGRSRRAVPRAARTPARRGRAAAARARRGSSPAALRAGAGSESATAGSSQSPLPHPARARTSARAGQSEIRRAARLEEGDPVEFEIVEGGILLKPRKIIDATQAWFWTPAWQAGEAEAAAEISRRE